MVIVYVLLELVPFIYSHRSSFWFIHAESSEWGVVVEQMLMEVVNRARKLHCGPWTEVVSRATPPHLVKVKINFDEAQKLTWK